MREPAVVPLVLALLAIGTLLSSPVQNAISRQIETRADVDALEVTRDAASFEAVQKQLALRSLADPTPPRITQFWFGSHPIGLTRIAIAAPARRPRVLSPVSRGGRHGAPAWPEWTTRVETITRSRSTAGQTRIPVMGHRPSPDSREIREGTHNMQHFRNLLQARRVDRDEAGASAVEYGLLVAGIAALIVAVVFLFGGMIKSTRSPTPATQIATSDTPPGRCSGADLRRPDLNQLTSAVVRVSQRGPRPNRFRAWSRRRRGADGCAEHDERGASAVEYGLLIAGIAALIVAAVFLLGGMVQRHPVRPQLRRPGRPHRARAVDTPTELRRTDSTF